MKKRVLSLLSSTTEVVYALGCGDQLVGRSHECDYPPAVMTLPICTKPKFNVDGSSIEVDGEVKSILQGALSVYYINEDLLYLRTNFDKSDNRNFRDGDKQSSRYFDDFEEGEDSNSDVTRKMYDSPKHIVGANSDGTMNREYDKSNTRTSLVNDQARVYKGGSWKDREFWIDPAQRRFYPEDMATDFIGFRCAMSRVGSKSMSKKKNKN